MMKMSNEVKSNTIENALEHGIRWWSTRNSTVESNVVKTPKYRGISIHAGDPVIKSNTIEGAGTDAIFLDTGVLTSTAVESNVVKGKVGEFAEEDLIPNDTMIVTLTKTGYIKRLSPSSYRAQARGGKGVIGMTTKEEDEIEHLVGSMTHDNILFFTNNFP